MPDGSSPMIAPMIDAAAAIRSAAKRYGTEVGSRSRQRTWRRDAAYDAQLERPRIGRAKAPERGDRRPGRTSGTSAMTATPTASRP